MIWYFVRAFFYIMLCACLWFGGQFFIAQELQKSLAKISPYAIYVDKSTQRQLHTGSLSFPFSTITEALEAARVHNIRTVIISSGTYTEHIVIPDNVLLFGYNPTTITYDPLSLKNVVQMGDRSMLLNITVSGGLNAIMIPHNITASLINVTASDADDFGVLMDKKERPPIIDDDPSTISFEYLHLNESEIATLPLVHFRNITVTQNKNQGMYLRDGRILIENSHIFENGEEGIDLHPHMIATISHTNSSRNGESGLETEIYDNIVTIENSTFDGNIKNGIAFITSYGIGKMHVRNSTIINNQTYGIRCARHTHSPEKPRPFFRSVITQENNTIENNLISKLSEHCILF